MLFKYEDKRHECQQNVHLYIHSTVSESQNMAPHYRKIANCLFDLANSTQTIFPSRKYLANYAGVSERTVSRAFVMFERIGFIKRIARPSHSNAFALNAHLADQRVRFALRPFFKALSVIPIAFNLLLSPLQAQPIEIVSNSIESSILILKEDIYNYITETKPTDGRIRARRWNFGSVFKKEIDMNEFKRQGSVIPDSVKKCGLHLTAIGQADLARYPDEAIKYALDQLKLASDVSDPFRYVCKIANNYCKSKNIHPDHTFAGKHFELLEAEITSPRLIDTDLSDLIGGQPKQERPKYSKQGYTVNKAQSDVLKMHPEYQEEERIGTEQDKEFYDKIDQNEGAMRNLLNLGLSKEQIKNFASLCKKNMGL